MTTTGYDDVALSKALDASFQRPSPQCPDSSKLYKIDDAYGGRPPYWASRVRSARFSTTIENGILYRPKIVCAMCSDIDNALNQRVAAGIMVKGPQGIGKSHSLVNTVLQLEARGNYLVTFVPDCEQWPNARYLIEQICASFGSSCVRLGIIFCPGFDYEFLFDSLLDAIDSKLVRLGKKWVFLFDQINKIFNKPKCREARDASGLPFPFDAISRVRRAGRVTSVISASANNEMAYRESHEGFQEFDHITNMIDNELSKVCDAINAANIKDVLADTDGVPLYAIMFAQDKDNFYSILSDEVYRSLERLRPQTEFQAESWKLVQRSIFSSLLGTKTESQKYDKKFLILGRRDGTRWEYRPLLPAVLSAYRHHLWDDLMAYVEENEKLLLQVCSLDDTNNDTRGRLFETIVIRRCQSNGVKFQVGPEVFEIASGVGHFRRFAGKLLPRLTAGEADCIAVPMDPNFPAIDLIWKYGNIIFGVQVHVNEHEPVASDFFGLCRHAGWFESFEAVHLLYLGPEEAVTKLVLKLTAPPVFSGRSTRALIGEGGPIPQILLRAISRESIEGLSNMQWPPGCSLKNEQGM